MTKDGALPGPEDSSQALREALGGLAAADAPGVIERARSRAIARVERLLEEAMVEELLAAVAPRQSLDGDKRTAAPVADEPAVRSEPEGEVAWWTYCIIPEADAAAAAFGLEGIEPGSRVEVVCDRDLAALVSRVPLSEYGDERLRAHLEDLEWLARVAQRHEDVLDAALAETTLVPLRLCTLYRSTDGVRGLLADNRAALREELGRVAGCVEWGIKVFADTTMPSTEPVAEVASSEGRGASYLLRRQQERALAEKAGEVRARCVEVVHQRVGALARASTSNPPQRPELHGREQTMLLNAAHLIERARTTELEDTVSALQEEWSALGFAIELTGPWPPYNFVSGTAGLVA